VLSLATCDWLLAIIEERGFLKCAPTGIAEGGRKWIDPKAVSTADRALAHGRRLGAGAGGVIAAAT
jgi:hypothetical protein